MLKAVNQKLGKFMCWLLKNHRSPSSKYTNRVWNIEFCNRCGYVFKIEKIGMTFRELLDEEYFGHENQVW